MTDLTAEKLVEMIETERRNHWQNSDLMNETEKRLEIIADHYKAGDECADNFNVSGFEAETLIDFIRESNFENTDLSDWICEERPKQQDEVYIEEIDYRNAEGYWKAGKTWEQMKSNEWRDGDKLTIEKIKELQNECPEGFYLSGWRKDNEDSEADLYLTPKQTYQEGH